jgi:hypothetical protein
MSGARAPVPRTLSGAAASFFSFGSPRLLAAQLACALAARPFLGPPVVSEVAVAIGVALYWPLQEWAAHRWILHARPVRVFGRTFESAAARKHRRHHEDPTDLQGALLPTVTILMLVPIHVGLWLLLAPSPVACTGIACFGGAALFYEWIHFLTHTAHRPSSRWFGEVKRRHMAHHQRDPQRWFGFMVPALDDWLGTGEAARRP